MGITHRQDPLGELRDSPREKAWRSVQSVSKDYLLLDSMAEEPSCTPSLTVSTMLEASLPQLPSMADVTMSLTDLARSAN